MYDKKFNIIEIAEILFYHHARLSSSEDHTVVRSVIDSLDDKCEIRRMRTYVNRNALYDGHWDYDCGPNIAYKTKDLVAEIEGHLFRHAKALRQRPNSYSPKWVGNVPTPKPETIEVFPLQVDEGFVAIINDKDLEFTSIESMENYISANHRDCILVWVDNTTPPKLNKLKWQDDDD